jgi:hypothetical protein
MAPVGNHRQSNFWLEFLCLWTIAAATDALSSLLIHFPSAALERLVWIPLHSESARALLIALVAQNSFRLAIAVGVGLIVAPKVGLGAPILEAWLRSEPVGTYLRRPLLPIFLTVFFVITCSVISNSSMLHPNRGQAAITATELANSPARAQLDEQLDRVGLSPPAPYTNTSLTVTYFAGAIGGELNARLFEMSVIVLLLIQICGKAKRSADRKFFWLAVLIVALVNTVYSLWARHESTLLVAEVFRSVGLSLTTDPYWAVALRDSIPLFPPAVAFGYLYWSYGIESAIVASFAGSVVTHWFMALV